MSAATKKSNRAVLTARMDGAEFRKQLLEQGWGPAEIVRALRALTKQALAEWKEDKRNKRILLSVTDRRVRLQVGHRSYLLDRRTGTLGTRPGRRENQKTIC